MGAFRWHTMNVPLLLVVNGNPGPPGEAFCPNFQVQFTLKLFLNLKFLFMVYHFSPCIHVCLCTMYVHELPEELEL